MLSASKIGKPWLCPEYIPIPFERYVAFHNGSSNPARTYDHWQEVLNYIGPVCAKENIQMVQIGGSNDVLIDGAIDFRGSSKRQMQHVVQHSMMFLGNDTCSAHFASAMNKDIVMIHSCLYPENSRPYWSNNENCVVIEAPRGDNKPSFSLHEVPKTINGIAPEEIANEFFKMLGIPAVVKEETKFIGNLFPERSIDIVPSKEFDPKFLENSVNFRMDLHYDLQNLPSWAHHCRVNIITKKALPTDILAPFKQHILGVQCDASADFTVEEIKQMRKAGVRVFFFLRGNEGELKAARLKYFEEHVHWLNNNKPTFESLDNLAFYSNRSLFDQSNEYLTEWHYSAKIPASSNRGAVEHPDILNASDYLRIVQE